MANEDKFTKDEAALLLQLLGGLQVQPTHPDAVHQVMLVQAIKRKVEANLLAESAIEAGEGSAE